MNYYWKHKEENIFPGGAKCFYIIFILLNSTKVCNDQEKYQVG